MKKNILLAIGFLGLCGQISAMETKSLISDEIKAKLLEKAFDGDIRSFKDIAQRNGLDLSKAMHTTDDHGDTPLIKSAYQGHHKFINFAIENGATIDAQNKNGETALIIAVTSGDILAVDKLLTSEANVNIQDIRGRTALIEAGARLDLRIIESLLYHNANKNLVDKQGRNALWHAEDRYKKFIYMLK